MTAQTLAFDRIAIVGVGLLGGSLGLAAKSRHICREVVGVGRSQAALEEALRLEAVDRVEMDLAEGVRHADLIVLCTPVRNILEQLPIVLGAAKPGAIVTDVGSTKASIVRAGDELAVSSPAAFVGSHPMAGSDKSGVRYSQVNLYENATCFVTRSAATDQNAFGKVCAFWEAVGSRIVVLRPERHDSLVARISHLPHLLAVALMQAVDDCAEDQNLIKGIIGNGFRDVTRIARGDARMWEDICAENTDAIVEARKSFDKALEKVMSAVGSGGDALRNVLEEASESRQFLDQR